MPAHLLAVLHYKAGQVSEDIAVNGVKQPVFFTSHLIENHETCDQLAIYVFWASIGICFAFCCDNNRSHQSGVCLHRFINVPVIPPHNGTCLSCSRAAVFVGKPVVSKFTAGTYNGTPPSGNVIATFIVFVVMQAMRVHAMCAIGAVQK